MIVRDDQFAAFAAPSLEELHRKVLRDEEKLKDQLQNAGGRLSLILLLLSLTGWGLVVFMELKPSWLSHLITAFTVLTLVYLAYRRTREIPVIRKLQQLEAHYQSRLALMPIHLWTLPNTTFVAVLTVRGGFDLLPIATAELTPILRERFGDTCVVSPPLQLVAPSARQILVEEFGLVLNALAGGVGGEFMAPTDAEAVQINRLAFYEDRSIRSN